jgi:hypothetical protein
MDTQACRYTDDGEATRTRVIRDGRSHPKTDEDDVAKRSAKPNPERSSGTSYWAAEAEGLGLS